MRPNLRRWLWLATLLTAVSCAEAPATSNTDDARRDAGDRRLDAGTDADGAAGDVGAAADVAADAAPDPEVGVDVDPPDVGGDSSCDDADGDGVCDADDVCPDGDDTRDSDEDGTPNACDPCPLDPDDDADGDGICANDDICPEGDDNLDADGDGRPNACDPCPLDNPDDRDGDGICDSDDDCPLGPDDRDRDGDGNPDACDPCPNDADDDSDGDGSCDSVDVCPGHDDRVDTDGDGVADGCDPCPFDSPDDPDGDGICTADDACPAGDDNVDSDGDTTADACDLCPGSDDRVDTDGDGVPNDCDLCEGGVDTDGDDVCDPDDPCPFDNPDDPDGDLVCTTDDVCLDGDDRDDADGDGIPDACDLCVGATLEDDDGDGVCNDRDICPGAPDDVDSDGDGIPDGCEAGPGSYAYDRLELGGIGPLESISFHPSGDYFVAVDRYRYVRVYDVETTSLTTFELTSTDGTPYSTEVEFAPDGSYALITGYIALSGGGTRATLRRFDHARWMAGDPDVIEQIDDVPTRGMYESVSYRGDGPVPLLVARSERSPYTMHLDAWDDDARSSAFVVATATSAGCQDIAYATNEFGGPGYLVVCGVNGYDAWYYTRVGGVWELRSDLGNNGLGNTSHVEANPTSDYALAISWSADAVYRFSAGLMQSRADFDFSRRRLWNLAFDRSGARALIVGQYQSTTDGVFGSAFEFRHDERDCPVPLSADCDLTEVAIPNFGSAPFNADNGTVMSDVAWRPGCDGGVIVTADTFPDRGMFITFEREGGVPCWP